jgi:hypothetical protein
MAQANSNYNADSSRRRFLAITAAASAVGAGSLAAAAIPPTVHQCDAEVAAAGARFEALFSQWMPAWLEWARLHCGAVEETEAKFGEQDHENPTWADPLTGRLGPASVFLYEAVDRNGCHHAADVEHDLKEQMEPLAELIRNAEVTSLAGLRAKTLVSILDFWPVFADHNGNLSNTFDTEGGHYSLFTGAVAVTGLGDLVRDIDERLAANACLSLRDSAPVVA